MRYVNSHYITLHYVTGTKPDQPHFTIIGSGSWSARASGAAALMRPSIERTNEQLDLRQQLANTPPPQSTTPGLHPVSIHQMAPPKRTSSCSLLLIYRLRKDGRLSWPSWLACSGRFTLIVVTRQMQAERRTGSVGRPKTSVLPTVLRNQRSLYVVVRPSVVCLSVYLSVVCNVRAPYSRDWNFSAMFLRHLVPWPSVTLGQKFYGDRPRKNPQSGG